MTRNKGHKQDKLNRAEALLDQMQVQFPRSREEVWSSLEKSMDSSNESSSKEVPSLSSQKRVDSRRRNLHILLYAAASIALLITFAAALRFHAVTVSSSGEDLAVNLPDGSSTILFYGELSYNPGWWSFGRTVDLQGDASFQVKKGKKFRVVSDFGTTTVLGTSFRIQSSSNRYSVQCYTGMVEVKDHEGEQKVLLTPNEQVIIRPDGRLEVGLITKRESNDHPINRHLVFKNQDVKAVLREIGVKFGVIIEVQEDLELYYSGQLPETADVETMLQLICKPLQLTYAKTGDHQYRIKKRLAE